MTNPILWFDRFVFGPFVLKVCSHGLTRGVFWAAALTLFCFAQTHAEPSSNSIDLPPVTYHGEIRSILNRSCTSCHQPGGVAPFSLTDYTNAAAMGPLLKQAVQSREMPPWGAARGCTEYEPDHSLTDHEISLISEWVDQQTPEGTADPQQSKPQPSSRELSRVDMTLKMPEAYSPKALEHGDYRCFLLPTTHGSEAFVTGFNALPGRKDWVHHMIAYLAEQKDADFYEQRDAQAEGPGYPCFGGAGGPSHRLESWAPGRAPSEFPAGTGIKLNPDSFIVLQVHYTVAEDATEEDRSAIELRIDSEVEHEATASFFMNPHWPRSGGMRIPAGHPDTVHSYSTDLVRYGRRQFSGHLAPNEAFRLHYIGLHMHTLGAQGKLWLDRKDGSRECLLEIPKWDFNWQFYYHLRESIRIEPGDRLGIECHWDNRGNDQDVGWGWGTNDEMCLGIVYLSKE